MEPVYRSLTELKEKLTVIKRRRGDSEDEGGKAMATHPLGPHNLDQLQTDLESSFLPLKEVLETYQSLLTQSLESRQSVQVLNQAYSKIPCAKAPIIFKEESKGILVNNLIKLELQEAKRQLALNLNSTRDRYTFYTTTLKTMAKELSLEHYSDNHGDYTAIMICGKIMVLDIEIKLTGEVMKAKITHSSPEHITEKIDNLFLTCLRNCDMKDFQFNLATLATIDSFTFKHSQVDFLHAFKVLERDLEYLFSLESATGNLRSLFENGHGIPLFHLRRWGPTLLLWCPPSTPVKDSYQGILEDIEKDPHYLDQFKKIQFRLETSPKDHPFLPLGMAGYFYTEIPTATQWEFQPITLPLLPNPIHSLRLTSPSAPVQWSAVLNPSILVTYGIAKQLSLHCGIPESNLEGIPMNGLEPIPFLHDCLVDPIMNRHYPDPSTRPRSLFAPGMSSWQASLRCSPHPQLISIRESPSLPACYAIHRLTLPHPTALFPMLQLLRQQCLFNTLLQSCFNFDTFHSTPLDLSLDPTPPLRLELHLDAAPSSLGLTLTRPSSHPPLSFQIVINPSTTGTPLHLTNLNLPSPHLLALLNRSLHLPLFIAHLHKELTTNSTLP